MSRLNSPNYLEPVPASPSNTTASFSDESPSSPRSPAPLQEFDPTTHKKVFLFDRVARTWCDQIVPLAYKSPSRTPSKTALLPPQLVEPVETEKDIIERIKTQITYKNKKIDAFFPTGAIQTFIAQLKRSAHYYNSLLLLVGGQVPPKVDSESTFNPEKDLDLEWIMNIPDAVYIRHYLIDYINSIAHVTQIHQSDSWILFKITWPHEIDLKISFHMKILEDAVMTSLAYRRIPDNLWDLTNNKLICYKDLSLRFLYKNTTPHDYAYVLLKLALYREKYPVLSADFLITMKSFLATKNAYVEREFFHLLRKKIPMYFQVSHHDDEQKIIDTHMGNIKNYIDSYKDPALAAFPSLPTIEKHAGNSQGLFTPLKPALSFSPPVTGNEKPKTPGAFSYSAIVRK